MTDINNVSLQAFQEEIENWELTLSRENKKLKQLRKVSNSKLQINTIDITLLNIETELIHYRQVKDQKISNGTSIIELYSALSKRFINLMQKIGEAAEQDRYAHLSKIDLSLQKTQENVCPNKTKHFQEGTFSYNVSRQPSRKKTNSVLQTKKQLNELAKSKKVTPSANTNKSINYSSKNRNKIVQLLEKGQLQEDSLTDISYQLKQIKSMMSQMDKEIKLHSHEQLEQQLTKLSHQQRKLTLQVKSIKDDNQFLLTRIQNIKEDIQQEKKAQQQMIQAFQAGKQNITKVNQLSKQRKCTQEISDWVKIRI